MNVKRMYLLAVLLVAVASYAYASTSTGTITITGQIVNSEPTSQSTTITPMTATNNNQTTTTYVVTSNITGRQLGSFDSLANAQAFVAQLNPVVPFEN